MRKYQSTFVLVIGLFCFAEHLTAEIFEGFEAKQFWQIAPWGDEAKSAISQERSSEGANALEVYFGPEMK